MNMSNKIYIHDFNDSGNLKGIPEMAEIGSKDDGRVVKMFSIKDKLYALKESSLYELQTTDEEGKKVATSEPTLIQKRVISKGPNSDFVSKTILTAMSVFQHGHFDNKIRESIFELCIDTLFEFSALIEAVNSYNQIEESQISKFEMSDKKDHNFVIPSISDIRTRAKTIFQKTDQISQNLISIIQLFYKPRKGKHGTPFEQLQEHFRVNHGEDNPYTKYLEKNIEFFCHIRFIRNGLDHTKAKFVEINDFEYQSQNLTLPTISLKRSECVLKETQFRKYINDVLSVYPYLFENIITMIADENIANNLFAYRIREIPENKRIFPKVRYAFWSPAGKDGFYNLNM